MFCIATFIVFGILSIFSATYRPLARAAWHCVWRRVTLRPCDVSFNEEMRGKLLAKMVFRTPRLAKFLDRWLDWISFAFVALSIWSLLYVANAGLNLWVYDTCNPANAESCSLSGEACGVAQQTVSLRDAIRQGRLGEWATGPFVRLGDTLSRIPDRLRSWDARQYLSSTASFSRPRDDARPFALEIVDPGCKFCKKLTGNLKAAGALDALNVSYILYPIKKPGEDGYHFKNSPLMASYIEAAKAVPLPGSATGMPGDWRLLEAIFKRQGDSGTDLQSQFNVQFSEAAAEAKLQDLLHSIGYGAADVARIRDLAHSPQVTAHLAEQRAIVEQKVRTIKIPTLLIGGRRFDRVIDVAKIKGMMP